MPSQQLKALCKKHSRLKRGFSNQTISFIMMFPERMRKEVILAILIGVTLGLIMTYGIYVASNSLSSDSNMAATPTPMASPVTASSTLVISSPEDESLVSESELTVAGTTIPDSTVVISLGTQDITTTADNGGHFSTTVTLPPGGSIIVITSIDPSGQTTTVERSVVLAVNEFLSIDDSSSSAKTAASPAGSAKPSTSPKTTVSPKPTVSPKTN